MSLTGSCFSSDSAPRALPSWDSRTRWNNLSGGLAVRRTVGPSGHANSPHPSSREVRTMLFALRAKDRQLNSWPELQIRITQLAREGSPPPGLRLSQAELSRKTNQVARARIRRF